MKMRGKGITEINHSDILQMFRTERDNQYDEILEECHHKVYQLIF
jgi:hypothetical protein